jgi:hypothetical protein
MRRLLYWCAGGLLGRQLVRAFVVVALACVMVAACGGDDGSDQTDGEDQDAGGTLDTGDDDRDGGGPPTAGSGEAGMITGAAGESSAPIPGCDDIDVQDRLAEEEYELLLDELDCVFENRDHVPPEALEIAAVAAVIAERALGESEETTDTGGEVEPEPETEPEPEYEPEAEADG